MSIVQVDDDDESRIVYDGRWQLNEDRQASESTEHQATRSGARATFTFIGTLLTPSMRAISVWTTSGSSIAVFGSVGSTEDGHPRTGYVLDDVVHTPFANPGSYGYRQELFASPQLEPGFHVLEIRAGDVDFWLDYIQYTPGDATSDTTTHITTSSSSNPDPPSSQSTLTTISSIGETLRAPSPSITPVSPINTSSSLLSSRPSFSITISTPQNLTSSQTFESTNSQQPTTTSQTPTTSSTAATGSSTEKSNGLSRAVLIGVIGGLISILLALIILFIWLRRRRAAAKGLLCFEILVSKISNGWLGQQLRPRLSRRLLHLRHQSPQKANWPPTIGSVRGGPTSQKTDQSCPDIPGALLTRCLFLKTGVGRLQRLTRMQQL